jgi:DNA-binding transcriptional MerR regulator/GGDEF domain-containing protein
MEEQSQQSTEALRAYLQRDEVQTRIRQSIKDSREGATVSIGRMAQLFHMKEAKIRELDAHHLLNPSRTKDSNTGQRQYPPSQLEKLAIINELLTQGRYSVNDIPENIDELWKSLTQNNGQATTVKATSESSEGQSGFHREADYMPIDKRVNHVYYKELFWRFYASHALELSAKLISEEFHLVRICLILPLHKKNAYELVHSAIDLPKIGESLVGWLGQTSSFYTFLTVRPYFEYPTDFYIFPLQTPDEDKPEDSTLIAIPRLDLVTNEISFSSPVVETIRRLLEPLYTEVADWNFFLGHGMRDIVDPLMDFNTNAGLIDTVLTHLAKTIVHLGGQNEQDEQRWRFCCILTPNDLQLPLQQRSLVVRAKSKYAPSGYKIGTTFVAPNRSVVSLSLRAYQSGRIAYRPLVTPEDLSVANQEQEAPISSAIAVPVGGENGTPIAVIYVVSSEPDAFDEDDQRVLRMIERMVEELLLTYQAHLGTTRKLSGLMASPAIVDSSFAMFATENDLMNDITSLLYALRYRTKGNQMGSQSENPSDFLARRKMRLAFEEVISFIGIDVDNHTSYTLKYGERMSKNLSRLVGLRIQRQLPALFSNPDDCRMYHAYGDRYYVLLNGISLEQARTKAELLKDSLNDTYQVDALRFSIEQPTQSETMLVSADKITVRLGVSSYDYKKLEEVLQRYPDGTTLSSTMALIVTGKRGLDHMLKLGQGEGGDVIISWDPEIWAYRVWEPS